MKIKWRRGKILISRVCQIYQKADVEFLENGLKCKVKFTKVNSLVDERLLAWPRVLFHDQLFLHASQTKSKETVTRV